MYRQLKPDVTLFNAAESVLGAVLKDFPATEAEVPGADIVWE